MIKKPYEKLDYLDKFGILYGEKQEWQVKRHEEAFNAFKKMYGVNCAYVSSSSGRVEIIGNHTDHNGGKVISCAISLDTLAFFLPNDSGKIEIFSEGYGKITVDTDKPETEKYGTPDSLVRGVIVGLKDRGYKIGGFNGYFTSNVTGGAGISSSASFEVLICEIENFLFNDGKVSKEEKSVISQFAENKYFGKPCGLLDQTAIAYGGLKKLDFKDKSKIGVSDIKSDLKGYTLVLIKTGGSHENLTDEYAAIPSEMKAVAKSLGGERLIDFTKREFLDKLPALYNKLSDRAILRAFHFYEENERVDEASKALSDSNFEKFLCCVNESGISSLNKLQNCYVATGKDQSIPKALAVMKPYLRGGANRVHGGGFAGSILNIVKNENKDEFVTVASKYFGAENVIPLLVRTEGTIVL